MKCCVCLLRGREGLGLPTAAQPLVAVGRSLQNYRAALGLRAGHPGERQAGGSRVGAPRRQTAPTERAAGSPWGAEGAGGSHSPPRRGPGRAQRRGWMLVEGTGDSSPRKGVCHTPCPRAASASGGHVGGTGPCPARAQPPGGNAVLLKRGTGERCSSEPFPPLGCQSVCLASAPQSCVLTVRRFVGSVLKCFAESGPRRSHCSLIILSCIHVLFSLGFQQVLEAEVSASAMPRARKSQIFYWCSSSDLGLWAFVIPQRRSTDAQQHQASRWIEVHTRKKIVKCL